MPSGSRRKAKQSKKLTTLTTTKSNHHSSPAVQLQGSSAVSAKHSKMEGSFNGTLEDTLKVTEESLSQDKEVVAEVAAAVASETPNVDIAITDKQAAENEDQVESSNMEEETKDVAEESVADSDSKIENTLSSELGLKEDADGVKETELPPSEDNDNKLSSVSENEGLKETEVDAEEEKNVLSSAVTDDGLLKEGEEPNKIINISSSLPPTDEVSKETSNPNADESDKVPPTITGEVPKGIEKAGEQSDVQESSSYDSAKESFQPSPNILDAKTTSTNVQDRAEEPRSFENPTIAPVTQRQRTSWNSCCGLFEILRRGDR
ncbi:hypothetical protein SESBI_47278 [Sesbania bispinosa]|nr:hypothetical protein SESBI_47278 [Sesbania bispinosa]